MATQLVWLVTGCSSGIGEELVRQILSRGDHVIATARKLEKIEHFKEQGAAILQLDVTADQKTLNDTISKALSIYGRIDVLVNNAGYILTGSWEDLDYEDFLAQFETNVFGVIKVTKAVLPHFRERRSGTAVFIGSRSGWYGDPFCGAYAGSKFALEGLVESFRWETERFGIRTLLIHPGRFRGRFLSPEGNLGIAKVKNPDYEQTYKEFLSGISEENGRQPGDVQKGVSVILDLVRQEGIAKGREVPFRMPLGTDCYETLQEECEETLKSIRDWEHVIKGTDY